MPLVATAGAIVSILIVAILLDPGPAPLLPALSVAVQVMLLIPSAETVSEAVALGVSRPVIGPTVAPMQLITVIVLPPVVVSLALTLPMTGEATNQPF